MPMATLKGIFPNPKPPRRKNFIQENVKNLRRMEQFFHTKGVEEFQKLQLQKKSVDKYQNVGSRINSSLRNGRNQERLGRAALRHSDEKLEDDGDRLERKVSAPIPGKAAAAAIGRKHHRSPAKLNLNGNPKEGRGKTEKSCNERSTRASSNPNLYQEHVDVDECKERDYVKYRNQGIQTLEAEDMGSLYREGIIRYPSSRSSKKEESPNRNTDRSPRRDCQLSDRGDISPSSPRRHSFEGSNCPPATGDQVDHIKLNKQRASSVASKFATQLNNGVPPASYRKGVVPKYIRDRKEAQQQRDEKIKAAASHPDCPEGHVHLPDDERKETLRMLKKNYKEYVTELNMMPIKTDTLRAQTRKMEIEKQLNKLEEGIKVFSRPKVFVRINA